MIPRYRLWSGTFERMLSQISSTSRAHCSRTQSSDTTSAPPDLLAEHLHAGPTSQSSTENLLARIDSFNAQRLVGVLESVLPYKLGAETSLVRGILGALRLKLNDLTLVELTHCYAVIQKVKGADTLFRTIESVIPVIFQSRYRAELDVTDVNQCFRALIFVFVSRLDLETSDFVARATARASPLFTKKQAQLVLQYAGQHPTAVQQVDSMRNILVDCMDIISSDLSTMDEATIRIILRNCCKHREATKSFLNVLWELAPSWSLTQIGLLLKTSHSAGYMTPRVGELVTRLIVEKKDQLNQDNSPYAAFFADAIASWSVHQLPGSDGMARCLQAANHMIEEEDFTRDLHSDTWNFYNFLIGLSFIGVYPESLLRNAFDAESQRPLTPKKTQMLVQLERQLRLYYGESLPHIVQPELKAELAELYRAPRSDAHFDMTLEAVVGGPQYFCSRVRTPLGTMAHYVVAMLKEDLFVPVVGENIGDSFEHLPPGAKTVAIIICEKSRDVLRLTGSRKMSVWMRERQLQAQSFCTAIIDWDVLSPPQPCEAMPRVARALREAFLSGPVPVPKFLLEELHRVI